MKNILLTGGCAPATLHAVRLLKAQGHQIYVADPFKWNLAGASGCVSKNFKIPSPRWQPKKFVNTLKKILKDYNINLWIPTCEEVFHVAKHRHHFEAYCQIFAPSLEELHQLHHKFLFNQLLQKTNLPAPKTILATNPEELQQAIRTMDSFVAKPVYSRFADNVIINDIPKTRAIIPTTEAPWVVQQYISGKHYCSFSVFQEGQLVAHSVYPITHRAEQGAAIYFESEHIPEIEQIAATIGQQKNITGFLSFDFIQSGYDQQFYAIECNPRLTSGIHLFDEQNSCFPNWDNSTKTVSNILYPNTSKPYMLTLAMLLYVVPRVKSVKEGWNLLKALYQANDAVFTKTDWQPALKQFLSFYYFYQLSQKYNTTLLGATTYHIEWNGK